MTGSSVSPPPADRLIAGRYRLRFVLGRGATGTVWSADDEVLLRPVAVKVVRLPPGTPRAEIATLHERTLREARAIAALSHPNVITVYDVAQSGGAPVVVMELISGRSLAAVLGDLGRLNTEQAAAVADAVAAALGAAHQAGITHRDVKPGNVLVGRDGRIKLTDFGIARNVSDSTMTHTGIVLGSPAFIAPEIAAGEPVSPAADLWSLGAMLFAAVEGRPPYDVDGDALATITEVVRGEVPVAETAGPLQEVIGALMVKDPARRVGLATLRRMLYPLLREPGRGVFEPADLQPGEPLPEDAVKDGLAQQEPWAGHSAAAPNAGQSAADLPLSADPGPLPFTPAPPALNTRRPRSMAVPVIVAVALFCVMAGGGFAAARLLAGAPLAPPSQAEPTAATGRQPTGQLELVTGTASTFNGVRGGGFEIKVPRGWASFTEQRTSTLVPPSTAVHYVSADGEQEITVERLANFYPHTNITTYLGSLRANWPQHDFTLLQNYPITGIEVAGPESATRLMYRTVENGRGPDLGRSTFADVEPDGDDLWVVAVTVPTEQEDSGTTLFDQIAPTLRPTG